ncbi:MAG: universal stress protein [Terracidiphilus sp.]
MSVTNDQPNQIVSSVVYATDFSSSSENAGNYAKLLAQYFRATLVVAHAFIPTQAAMELEAEGKYKSAQRWDLEHLLQRKISALSAESLRIVPVLLEKDPHGAICAYAESNAPALIVLGTHGGGRIERGIIGSVAETILRSTRWPCLTVGPAVPLLSSSLPTLPFRRILCATDLTPVAAEAVSFAFSLAQGCRAEIEVLNVTSEKTDEDPSRMEEVGNRFRTWLDQFVPEHAKLEDSHPRILVEAGRAHRRLLDHVKDRSIDLLVLGIRKTSHLGLDMRTSGAFQIIVEANCPVLTITGRVPEQKAAASSPAQSH